jgi:hypothetical protein
MYWRFIEGWAFFVNDLQLVMEACQPSITNLKGHVGHIGGLAREELKLFPD